MAYEQAAPLRNGSKFCSWHCRQALPRVQCEAMTKKGWQCRISNWDGHAGAKPLREGGVFCAKHVNGHES